MDNTEQKQKTFFVSKSTLFLIVASTILFANEIVFTDHLPGIVAMLISASRLLLIAYCLTKTIDTKFIVPMFLFAFIIALSNYVNGLTSYIPIVSKSLNIFAFYVIYSRHIKDNPQRTLRVFSTVSLIFILINFFLLIIKPAGLTLVDGRYGRYFLGGNYNTFAPIFLLSIVFSVLYDKNYTKSLFPIRSLLVFGVTILSLLIVGSKTGLVGLFLVICYVFSVYKMRIAKIAVYAMVGFFIFGHIIFVLVQGIDDYPMFANFVESVLGKNLTFSNRTFVWMIIFQYIIDQPILGYGYRDIEWYDNVVGVVNSHNQILSLLMKGGICLVVAYIFLIFRAFKGSEKIKLKTRYNYVFMAYVFAVLSVMMIMEAYNPFLIFAILIITYNIHNLDEQQDKL